MGKMKFFSVFILYIVHLSLVCKAETTIQCNELTSESGEIIDTAGHATDSLLKNFVKHSKCWTIVVPGNSKVEIYIESMEFSNMSCFEAYVLITFADSKEQKFCFEDVQNRTITAFNDVTITYIHDSTEKGSTLNLKYQIETGISTIEGLDTSRKDAISWLRSKQLPTHGWGDDTSKVITALSLSGDTSFNGDDLKEELMMKQMEVQTAVALLRDSREKLNVNELSAFINGMRMACLNPRAFYGYDILKMLSDRLASVAPSPAAYLTLCTSNWTITEANMKNVMKILEKSSKLPFYSDMQAMTVVALSCMRNKINFFEKYADYTKILNTTIERFMSSQLPDGSFGNIHTTALITQALLSIGEEKRSEWNVTAAVRYLMNRDKSSMDLISTSMILPIFNQKTLADITTKHCKKEREHGKDRRILELMNKEGTKKDIEYSLYVGDKKNVVHVKYLRMPDSVTAYDVMNLAAYTDPKFNFTQTDLAGHIYVHKIAGISNDPEEGKFWHLYFGHSNDKGRIELRTESPDKVSLKGGNFVVMWYKTLQV